jgi:hypothetical protein
VEIDMVDSTAIVVLMVEVEVEEEVMVLELLELLADNMGSKIVVVVVEELVL